MAKLFALAVLMACLACLESSGRKLTDINTDAVQPEIDPVPQRKLLTCVPAAVCMRTDTLVLLMLLKRLCMHPSSFSRWGNQHAVTAALVVSSRG